MLTACADANARLFVATTGEYIARMPHDGLVCFETIFNSPLQLFIRYNFLFSVVRVVKWGDGNKQFATASDPFSSRDLGAISIFDFPTPDSLVAGKSISKREDPAPLQAPTRVIYVDDNDKATSLAWTIGDREIIAGFDSGNIVKYDVETGKEICRNKIHTDRVNRVNFNRDKSMLISASKDCNACLIDPNTLDVIRTFKTDRPVNGAVISSTHPHVLLGGGQDAQSVTTTSASQGKFETRFFHMVYGEEFGRVKGHFGPINALDIHPFGRSYASGSEDG